MNVDDELIRALELERASGQLSRRWLHEEGSGSPVYDILERHAAEDDRHGQTLWNLLVDRSVAPPETSDVETPEDFPGTLIGMKESLVGLYDRMIPELAGRDRKALERLRTEDDDQRALLSVYFPAVGGMI
jgi:hypothetical protein